MAGQAVGVRSVHNIEQPGRPMRRMPVAAPISRQYAVQARLLVGPTRGRSPSYARISGRCEPLGSCRCRRGLDPLAAARAGKPTSGDSTAGEARATRSAARASCTAPSQSRKQCLIPLPARYRLLTAPIAFANWTFVGPFFGLAAVVDLPKVGLLDWLSSGADE